MGEMEKCKENSKRQQEMNKRLIFFKAKHFLCALINLMFCAGNVDCQLPRVFFKSVFLFQKAAL